LSDKCLTGMACYAGLDESGQLGIGHGGVHLHRMGYTVKAASQHNSQAWAQLAGILQTFGGCFRIDFATHFWRADLFRSDTSLSITLFP